MVYLVLVVLAGWAALATVACLAVCISAGRFNHEAEEGETALSFGRLSRS